MSSCYPLMDILKFPPQEGQTYVGREDASTEQDIGETISEPSAVLQTMDNEQSSFPLLMLI